MKTRMNRLFFLFLLMLLPVVAGAQELTVKSFVEKTTDLSASTQMRKDLNDTPCALVKVQLASRGAQFEGNVIGSVAYKTSEYWVYLPDGSKRLTVKLEGYLPLSVQFADYGTPALKSKTTYVLTITGVVNNVQQTQQPTRTQTGWIILDSEPQGAAVYINDEFVGNTPMDGYKQAYGTYSYRLDMPKYHSATGTLELNSSNYEKKITLAPAFGAIKLVGESGAAVLLDGEQTGKTVPCTLNGIPSGQHTITLQKAKYAPRQLTASVQDGQTTTLTASLDARFATLTIKSLQGAQIYVDGKQKGTTSYSEELMEGYHDIEARLAHHKTVTQQLQLTAGQAQTITLTPTPIYGSLDVVTNPRAATITIDGKEYGKSPTTIEQLIEGEHSVTISLAGYASVTKSVTIQDGQTSSVSATLQSGRPVTITCIDAGARIYIDDTDVGPAPYTGSLSFGEHTAYAMKDGKKTGTTRISVPQGSGSLPNVVLSFFGPQTFTVKGVSFTMMPVEGGAFTMGATSEQGSEISRDDRPTHRVTLNNYYMGETEVTQKLWKAVMGNSPSNFKGDNQPVEQVSWSDCQTFIQKLNSLTGHTFRLPTEAEWEYAARGGKKSQGYKYSGSNNLDEVAWYTGTTYDSGTKPVKTKRANELGLYDMSGNISEWCQDWYGSYSGISQTNPTGPGFGSARVTRGGCWLNVDKRCSLSNRDSYTPDTRNSRLGFRLCLSSTTGPSASVEAISHEVPSVEATPADALIDDPVDDKIYDVVEVNAQFLGGDAAMYEWISKNLIYPKTCQEQGIQGRVNVKFVINVDGSITDIEITRSPDDNLSKEAIRLVKLMPKWKPARQGNKMVRSRFVLPVLFRL